MKQTAVECLEQEIFRRYKFTFQQLNCQPLEEAIEQAKEMEKQQIIDAYEKAMETDIYNTHLKIGEQYYNETYKK
jgi:hypothetical protein